jgi:hypothetical protein
MDLEKLISLHAGICQESRELMLTKNHDYTAGSGDPFANFRAASALGVHPITGVGVRMIDKIQRLRTYAERGKLEVSGEGFRDSVVDLVNYSVLMAGLAQENQI